MESRLLEQIRQLEDQIFALNREIEAAKANGEDVVMLELRRDIRQALLTARYKRLEEWDAREDKRCE